MPPTVEQPGVDQPDVRGIYDLSVGRLGDRVCLNLDFHDEGNAERLFDWFRQQALDRRPFRFSVDFRAPKFSRWAGDRDGQ